MITRTRLKRAAWSIKNEGVMTFTGKFIRFMPWAVGRSRAKYNKYLPPLLRANNSKYSSDYIYLTNPIFNITSEDLRLSHAAQSRPKPEKIRSATWFVPTLITYLTAVFTPYSGLSTTLRQKAWRTTS